MSHDGFYLVMEYFVMKYTLKVVNVILTVHRSVFSEQTNPKKLLKHSTKVIMIIVLYSVS